MQKHSCPICETPANVEYRDYEAGRITYQTVRLDGENIPIPQQENDSVTMYCTKCRYSTRIAVSGYDPETDS